jgi:hypothetical protein
MLGTNIDWVSSLHRCIHKEWVMRERREYLVAHLRISITQVGVDHGVGCPQAERYQW